MVARAALAVQPVRQEQQALAALVAKVAWAEPAESVAHNQTEFIWPMVLTV